MAPPPKGPPQKGPSPKGPPMKAPPLRATLRPAPPPPPRARTQSRRPPPPPPRLGPATAARRSPLLPPRSHRYARPRCSSCSGNDPRIPPRGRYRSHRATAPPGRARRPQCCAPPRTGRTRTDIKARAAVHAPRRKRPRERPWSRRVRRQRPPPPRFRTPPRSDRTSMGLQDHAAPAPKRQRPWSREGRRQRPPLPRPGRAAPSGGCRAPPTPTHRAR